MDKRIIALFASLLILILAWIGFGPAIFVVALVAIILFYLLFFGLLYYPYLARGFYVRKLQRQEWDESTKESAIKEAHPFRPLNNPEKEILEKHHKISKKFTDYFLLVLVLFLVYALVVPLLPLLVLDMPPTISIVYWATYILGLYIGLFIFSLILDEKDTYLDLRSPVFRVQGSVIKSTGKSKFRYKRYFVTVRKKHFSDADYLELPGFFEQIKDGEEIAVEYSPRTEMVWKMYKTTDLK